jgi:hypothetical protein
VVTQFGKKRALSAPENTGRRGLYKTVLVGVVGLVEAARFWGGQLFVLSRTKLSHYLLPPFVDKEMRLR